MRAGTNYDKKRELMEYYVTLIRHGMTDGNLKKRYIGRTDEKLSDRGREELIRRKEDGGYPVLTEPWHLYVSPMRRCMETAALLYPDKEMILKQELRECDFGAFENKNYVELSGYAPYEEWIASNGTLPFPGGESVEGFKQRCCKAAGDIFCRIWEENIAETVLVVHGGTIMSIMEHFSTVKKGYYEWSLDNGGLYRVRLKRDCSDMLPEGCAAYCAEEERILEPVALGKEKV